MNQHALFKNSIATTEFLEKYEVLDAVPINEGSETISQESERPSTNELEQIISAPEAELDELERELEKFINLELI